MRSLISILLLILVSSPVAAEESSQAFDFMEGSWTVTADGFSLTLSVEPFMDGLGWQATQMMDESNTIMTTTTYMYRPHDDSWMATWVNRDGRRSTFVGGLKDGVLVLEQVAFDAKPFEVVRSREVYRETEEGFILDWQSRKDEESE